MLRLLRFARHACETPRKLGAPGAVPYAGDPGAVWLALIAAFFAVACLLAVPRAAVAQPAQAHAVAAAPVQPGGAHEPGAAGEKHGAAEEHEGSGLLAMLARLVNFAVLAGTLVYLLRSPIAGYLSSRSQQIRGDLVSAAEMKESAAAQIEEIDRRMKALPGELEALRAQGAAEIAAEEARIQAAAAAERSRLLEQARREIDMQVKIAERELVSRAADLAVGAATERIKNVITEDDQQRLVDRYVQQLKS